MKANTQDRESIQAIQEIIRIAAYRYTYTPSLHPTHNMKTSLRLLHQAAKAAQSAPAAPAATATPNAEYFNQLPQILRNFFSKHTPASHTQYSTKPTLTTDPAANPFLPNKHPVTQAYHAPVYSLRRQAVLYKTAQQYGIADLLPSVNRSFYEDKYQTKKFMKGVLKPKGHKHELNKPERKAQVDQAMEQMESKIAKVKGSKYRARLQNKKEKSWY